AHYRKHITGGLDDDALRKFNKRFIYLQELKSKKEELLDEIKSQDRLSDEIKDDIDNAKTLIELEDLYRPYLSKEDTKEELAKEQGLQPLANMIRFQQTKIPVEDLAKDFLSEEGVSTVEEAINGAQDIITGLIADDYHYRELIRNFTFEEGDLFVEAKDLEEIKDNEEAFRYELYYNHSEKIIDIADHRVLAINRGESEGFLKVQIKAPVDEIISYLKRHFLIDRSDDRSEDYNELTRPYIEKAIVDAYEQVIAPAIEQDIRNYLTERAERQSIEVFSKNLEALLMKKPLIGKVILGWNYSTYSSSKIAILDKNGDIITTETLYFDESYELLKDKVGDLINKHHIDAIALGSGSDSKIFEEIISEIIEGTNVKYAVVNQAGASVYYSSFLGEMEYTDYSKGEKIAISIARRLQNPFVEFVKVDPKSIGVGQYQHDMDQEKLTSSLMEVLEKVVNNIGLDLNRASISLLIHVAGIDSVVATNIVRYREDKGAFTNRNELLKVKEMTPEIYQQCAGFLKVKDGDNILDSTKIHPEFYETTENLLKEINCTIDDIGTGKISFVDTNIKSLSQKLNTDELILNDLAIYIINPDKDPRDEMSEQLLKSEVSSIENLKVGMVLEGTVRNVVDFGAFVDIGVYHDGLIHISKMNDGKFVRHPSDIVSVGDVIKVRIIDLDLDKKRIQLSLEQ
ncbi:MAG: helix-hairpin-helix domain-containing protein, partial [Methanobrevibacter sp.]|nr:helix-hairpin-helix domain-containing protein [Methanobrevibacter sp.]